MCSIVLSLVFICRSKDAVKHFPVRWDGNHFLFGFAKFTNVEELISHFENKPVIGGDSGKYNIRYIYTCMSLHVVDNLGICLNSLLRVNKFMLKQESGSLQP